MTYEGNREKKGILTPVSVILVVWSFWLVYWFRAFLGTELQANTDLFGHIAMVERLGATWWDNPVFFYDRAWFTGWPAFQFYGFFAHLLALIVSIPLGYFVSDPARFSIYLLCIVQLSTLHWSVFYSARPFYDQVNRGSKSSERSEFLFSLVVCALTFWFLNKDGASIGVGASAILGAGLYSQLLGWHLLLIYVGMLFRLVSYNSSESRNCRFHWRRFSILFAIMVCTHTLTTLYAMFIGFLSFLRFAECRRFIARVHLIGLGLSAFWLLPMMALNSDYGVNHTEPPASGFFYSIFRYPWIDLVRSLRQVLHGRVPILSALEIMLPFIFLAFYSSRMLVEWRYLSNFGVFILLGLVIFSSPFAATALPLGIHYYRLDSFAILLLIPWLSAVSLSFLSANIENSLRLRIGESLLLVSVFLIVFTTALLPGVELGFVNAVNREKVFADQRNVLNYFKNRGGETGRVLFDYYIDAKLFMPATPHYMPSRLFQENGVETINGLFIQSSVAYQFPISSAVSLGLDYFAAPLPFAELEKVEAADAIRRLLSFGVTHIVSTDGSHIESIRPFIDGEVVRFGPYVILPLKTTTFSPISTIVSPIVGYLDRSGSLPFRSIEYFFFESAELWVKFEIIELSNEDDLPSEVSLLLFNGNTSEAEEIARKNPNLEVVAINFARPEIIDHYKIRYNFHRGNEDYADAKPYLQNILKTTLKPALDRVLSRESIVASREQVRLRWSVSGQQFDLDGLEPGKMVRIDYSYFPFWGSSSGSLYRGGSERMIFLPKERSAHFFYSRWRVRSTSLGAGVSLLCLVLLFFL